MKDKNDKDIEKGSIIDINQTVNGCRFFVILEINPLDIRYSFDLTYKYQYDKDELLAPNKFTDEVEFEIIDNVYKHLPKT